MIKMLALDLDGTLLRNRGTLSQETVKALRRAVEKGIKLVAASGRAFASLPEEILEFPGFEYAIASNGANIYDMRSGERIYANYLTLDSVDRLVKLAREKKLRTEACVGGIPFTSRGFYDNPRLDGFPESSDAYIKDTRRPVDDILAFVLENRERIDCMDYLIRDREKIGGIREIVMEDSELYVTSSAYFLIEMSRAGSGKGRGLKWLAETYGIDGYEIMAFGNADNDKDRMAYA
ncbi:MAG: HAD family phosphatase, partial [Oscillospiraceae bacterium]|nr:HAD family phosphatase [Oscillospiraceae bacterium]